MRAGDNEKSKAVQLVYDTLECAEAMMHACSLEPWHSPDALFPPNIDQEVTGNGNAVDDTEKVETAVSKVGNISNPPTQPLSG